MACTTRPSTRCLGIPRTVPARAAHTTGTPCAPAPGTYHTPRHVAPPFCVSHAFLLLPLPCVLSLAAPPPHPPPLLGAHAPLPLAVFAPPLCGAPLSLSHPPWLLPPPPRECPCPSLPVPPLPPLVLSSVLASHPTSPLSSPLLPSAACIWRLPFAGPQPPSPASPFLPHAHCVAARLPAHHAWLSTHRHSCSPYLLPSCAPPPPARAVPADGTGSWSRLSHSRAVAAMIALRAAVRALHVPLLHGRAQHTRLVQVCLDMRRSRRVVWLRGIRSSPRTAAVCGHSHSAYRCVLRSQIIDRDV